MTLLFMVCERYDSSSRQFYRRCTTTENELAWDEIIWAKNGFCHVYFEDVMFYRHICDTPILIMRCHLVQPLQCTFYWNLDLCFMRWTHRSSCLPRVEVTVAFCTWKMVEMINKGTSRIFNEFGTENTSFTSSISTLGNNLKGAGSHANQGIDKKIDQIASF